MSAGRPVVTGIGSWPGESPRQAQQQVRDLLAEQDLPYLPELPARGPGADLVGRSASLLVEMPVDLQPSGWRLTDRPGRDVRRAAGLLREDLDLLGEIFEGYAGRLKVQVCGPWTLASALALPRGEKAVVDPGATRDLTESLAEGLREHLRQVRALLPAATLVVQLDEPGLPAVLGGRLPSASGFSRLPAVEQDTARAGLRQVLEAADGHETSVHCCSAEAPVALLAGAGAGAVSVDTGLLAPAVWDEVAEVVESGTTLWAGVVPTDGSLHDPQRVLASLRAAWERLGLDRAPLREAVVSPACGLAGSAPAEAVRLHQVALQAAEALAEYAD